MANAIVAATNDSVTRIERGANGTWRATKVLPELDAQCLAQDPLNPQKLYAGGTTGGVYASNNGGRTWFPTPSQPPHPHISALAVSLLERKGEVGAVYAGTEPTSLYRSEGGGANWTDIATLRDIPSAPNWSFPARPWTSHVRWISLSPHDPDLMLVVVELGGIMRSDDGGVSWRDHPDDAYLDCHALAMPPDKPGWVYECANGGFAISRDGGLSWSVRDKGIDRRYLYSMAVDYANTDLVYIGASPDPQHAHYLKGDAQAAIYRRRPDGAWDTIGGELAPPIPHFPYALATAPGETCAIYVGFADGSLAISEDRGETWEKPGIEGERPREILSMIVLS